MLLNLVSEILDPLMGQHYHSSVRALAFVLNVKFIKWILKRSSFKDSGFLKHALMPCWINMNMNMNAEFQVVGNCKVSKCVVSPHTSAWGESLKVNMKAKWKSQSPKWMEAKKGSMIEIGSFEANLQHLNSKFNGAIFDFQYHHQLLPLNSSDLESFVVSFHSFTFASFCGWIISNLFLSISTLESCVRCINDRLAFAFWRTTRTTDACKMHETQTSEIGRASWRERV